MEEGSGERPVDIVLDETDVRVLGSLMEKELATPDYYPLSLNALTNACNQKSNRDPVVSYDEETVERAVEDLEKKGIVFKSLVGRVPKVEEYFTRENNLVPRESAVLCVLFLRGPQTPGMIRGRTERLCSFENLEEVHATLTHLEEGGYVRRLPRLAGHKESRYVHLLSGEPEPAAQGMDVAGGHGAPMDSGRMEVMEEEIQALRKELEDLKGAFQEFRRQFE
ncbi:MAG: YceH family protein [Thermodesulfobacteriota bacterium]|nr:YceH family protein [Thermodesulfobacteriota bacterium]